MNERTGFRKRHTVNLVNVGSGDFSTATFAPAFPKGRITEVTAGKAGGSGTQVQLQVKENGARMLFDSGPLGAFPLQKWELSRSYDLAGGQNIQVGVKVDQGADTNVAVEIVVEV